MVIYKDINEKLPDNILKEFKEKFNKRIYFDYNGSCKLGILKGIKEELSNYFYIIESNGKELYVPCFNSITVL